MNKRTIIAIFLGMALCAPAAAADAADTAGYLYGTVETDNGNEYTGLLRWGTEEAFWDDLFNSSKDDLPYLEEYGVEKRERNRIKVFGITVGYRWDGSSSSRMFIARFGDIERIDVLRGEKIEVVMRDGQVFKMEGGSNDVGAAVTVHDESIGEIKLDWDEIDHIVFRATPADVDPPAYRLYGEVETEDGGFEGYIQWDVQECLSSDKLDGDTEDGELSIDMGRIAAIEKRNRNGSRIELKDGRDFVLEDSNDVDSSLRGIFVEDPRYGRVKISWDAFERVDFRETGKSGRGYGDYGKTGKLHGTVTGNDGQRHSGDMVFDLDETAGWEMLNGDTEGVEFYIPFAMIKSIEPQRGDRSIVVLRSGEKLTLSEGQDVAESNDGVVVLKAGDRETYLAWEEIKKVEFD